MCRAVLTGQTRATYYVVELQGSVVAQLMITYEWSDWRAADVWWIQSVYVPPQHRQKVCGTWGQTVYIHCWRMMASSNTDTSCCLVTSGECDAAANSL